MIGPDADNLERLSKLLGTVQDQRDRWQKRAERLEAANKGALDVLNHWLARADDDEPVNIEIARDLLLAAAPTEEEK